jgi:hypothetical protein
MKTIISLSVALLLAGAGISCAEILTLRDCLKSAAAGNPSLKAAAFDEKIAREGIDQARSGYLPRVDFQGGYTAQLEPQAISFAGGRAINTQEPDFGFFSLSLYQTIYDFGRTGSRTRRATSLQEATRHAYAGQEKELFLQVVESYYGILMEQKMVQAAQEEVGQMTDHLRVAQHLYEQGVTTRNDLLQAEVKLAASKQSLLMANNRLANNWLRLNYLTGRPPQMQGELDDAPRYRLDADPVDVENALTRRDEIKSLKKTLEADEQAVQESKSGYYPELFAKAGDHVCHRRVEDQPVRRSRHHLPPSSVGGKPFPDRGAAARSGGVRADRIPGRAQRRPGSCRTNHPHGKINPAGRGKSPHQPRPVSGAGRHRHGRRRRPDPPDPGAHPPLPDPVRFPGRCGTGQEGAGRAVNRRNTP